MAPPRTDAMRPLARKEAELAEAERAVAAAREALDADAMAQAGRRAEALRQIVADLSERHHHEREAAARTRAEAWLNAQDSRRIVREAERAQERALDAIKAACEAIDAEAQARARLSGLQTGRELLAARWPDLTQADHSPRVPAPPDYVARVAASAQELLNRRRPFTTPGLPASATEHERRRAILRALYDFLARRSDVPTQVREIIQGAPQPSEIGETDEERVRREQRETRQAAQAEAFQGFSEEARMRAQLPSWA